MRSTTPLTPRQEQIAALVIQGRTSREIAAELGVAVQTVKNHRHTILMRLGARNVAEMIRQRSDNGK